jgi:hypothetical protein
VFREQKLFVSASALASTFKNFPLGLGAGSSSDFIFGGTCQLLNYKVEFSLFNGKEY